MKAVIVPAFGPVQYKNLDTLEDIKGALDGGWLEYLNLKDNAAAYIDEEGKQKNLLSNVRATKLGRDINPNWPDYIVGPMVIFGTLNEAGQYDCDEHDCPQWVLEYFGIDGLDK